MVENQLPQLRQNDKNETWTYGSSDRRIEVEKFELWCKTNEKSPKFEFKNINKKKRFTLEEKIIMTIHIISRCEVLKFF